MFGMKGIDSIDILNTEIEKRAGLQNAVARFLKVVFKAYPDLEPYEIYSGVSSKQFLNYLSGILEERVKAKEEKEKIVAIIKEVLAEHDADKKKK